MDLPKWALPWTFHTFRSMPTSTWLSLLFGGPSISRKPNLNSPLVAFTQGNREECGQEAAMALGRGSHWRLTAWKSTTRRRLSNEDSTLRKKLHQSGSLSTTLRRSAAALGGNPLGVRTMWELIIWRQPKTRDLIKLPGRQGCLNPGYTKCG